MNGFSEIFLLTQQYKTDIDALLEAFKAADDRMKNEYRNQIYLEKHNALAEEYRGKIAEMKQAAAKRINEVFAEIQDDLQRWAAAPVPEKLLPTLNLLIAGGVKLTEDEAEAIKTTYSPNQTHYLLERILYNLAPRKTARPISLNTYTDALKACTNEASISLEYIGTQFDLLSDENSRYSATAAGAGLPWRDNCAMLRAALLWGDSNVPSGSRKISADEKEIVDRIFSGCLNDESRSARMKELLAESPELTDVMRASNFAKYVPEDTDTGKEASPETSPETA